MGNTANQMRADDYNRQQQMYQWQQGYDQNANQFDQNMGLQNRQMNQQNDQFGRSLDQNANQFGQNLGFQNRNSLRKTHSLVQNLPRTITSSMLT